MKILGKRKNILLVLIVSLTGCELVESTQRVTYEDKTPVTFAEVHQWNDIADYTLYTNEYGKWSLVLPVYSRWKLCIRNPLDNYKQSCYDGILVVNEDGDLIDEP